ncbi:MAG: 2-oxoacid:ferredoxin oxidoreductase subunit beta [Candidatus Delongbacteria bacterium]|nr:2-oxoacid:ferredoxin oxidoreductase subunit beta [Candidatus Delongbacteria bacterium]
MAVQALKLIHKYLRHNKKFPHVWCPGCGNGIVLGTIIRAIDSLEIAKDDIIMVSGIGCSSRMPVYVDFNTVHTLHGRALTFATGIKLVKPDKKVIVITGDGDALAIGGNHFIHAARRNIDITTIIINNNTYGMTGGQFSPTTPAGKKGTTAPYGNYEPDFSIAQLATAAGATFVARGAVYHAIHLQETIKEAIQHKGFSVVEVISQCHTLYGRLNRQGGAVDMMKWQKEHAVNIKAADKMKPEDLQDKFLIGVLHQEEQEEYVEKYYRLAATISQKKETENS